MFIKLRARIHAKLMCLACGLYLASSQLRSCLFAKGSSEESFSEMYAEACQCISPSPGCLCLYTFA